LDEAFYHRIHDALADIDAQGLTKPERVIGSPQGVTVAVRGPDGKSRDLLNLCANNYLGLANNPQVVAATADAARKAGAGMASVRFICGTHDLHKQLERATADFLGYEDAILFAAAFDANGGVFEPLLSEEDAVVSDSLNHASIIDGVRLCKARRYRFANGDLQALEDQLKAARADGARTVLIATDGVFSMDGIIADLAGITTLADRYDALVLVDDCHATGFLGVDGRGSAAYRGVEGRIDILTGTYGKALGGAMGGFVCARQPVIDLLRQRARPYLFSNALAPAVCSAALAALAIVEAGEGESLRHRLFANARRFRKAMSGLGFDLVPGEHPIIPVMFGEARGAADMAKALFELGVFVTAFSFPVVPHGQARIRTQMSAALSFEQIDFAAAAFARARDLVEIPA
jgi:glycine C-acetyltransferase